MDRVWQKTGSQNLLALNAIGVAEVHIVKKIAHAVWEATCYNCQKRGHFSACCRASKICTIGGEALEESCKDTVRHSLAPLEETLGMLISRLTAITASTSRLILVQTSL